MSTITTSLTADVAVIGGGLLGMAAAYELSVAGMQVLLLDGGQPGRASDAGAGIASPQTFAEADPHWYRFGAAAADHLRALVSRLEADGVDVADAFTECGSLVVALAEHEEPWFEEVRALAMARDPAMSEVTPEEAQALFPPLCRPWRALLSPTSARLDGRLLLAALRDATTRRGVTHLSAEVTAITVGNSGSPAVAAGDCTVSCAAVVLAAGAWSSTLAAGVGVDLPVFPTKGEIVHVVAATGRAAYGPGAGGAAPDSRTWPIVQPVLNFYLVPWPGGRVACGGTFEPDAGFDVRPTAKGLRDLLRECLTIAPGLADSAVVDTRVGLRPVSGDDRPILGPLPGAPAVHACTGHGANGLLLGPYSAALVAEGIVREETPDPLAPYSASRFASP